MTKKKHSKTFKRWIFLPLFVLSIVMILPACAVDVVRDLIKLSMWLSKKAAEMVTWWRAL